MKYNKRIQVLLLKTKTYFFVIFSLSLFFKWTYQIYFFKFSFLCGKFHKWDTHPDLTHIIEKELFPLKCDWILPLCLSVKCERLASRASFGFSSQVHTLVSSYVHTGTESKINRSAARKNDDKNKILLLKRKKQYFVGAAEECT